MDENICNSVLNYIMLMNQLASGCFNKLPQVGGLKNNHLFLTVLEAGETKIEMPGDWMLGEGFHFRWHMPFSP